MNKWLLPLALLSLPLQAQDDVCLDCHDASVEASIHEDFDCETCHTQVDLEQHVEEETLPPPGEAIPSL